MLATESWFTLRTSSQECAELPVAAKSLNRTNGGFDARVDSQTIHKAACKRWVSVLSNFGHEILRRAFAPIARTYHAAKIVAPKRHQITGLSTILSLTIPRTVWDRIRDLPLRYPHQEQVSSIV